MLSSETTLLERAARLARVSAQKNNVLARQYGANAHSSVMYSSQCVYL